MLEMVSDELAQNSYLVWSVWGFVSAVLVLAAVIDGIKLKVPNWITFPLVIAGWLFSAIFCGLTGLGFWSGLGCSLLGTAVGLGLLLPAYAIGGMGAGDVKLLAGVGAWIGVSQTFWAFAVSVLIGSIIAIGMVLYQRKWDHHRRQFWSIFMEILIIRNPDELSELAAKRKSSMLLLPYGIPIAIGTIGYFAYMGVTL
jgi:prepilin peptidase CpaA